MKDEWRQRHEQSTPWQWRLDALSRCLTNWEWAVILMHYAKRRGFKSARKRDIAAIGSKGGTLDSTRANHDALAAYQTVARMFENDYRFIENVKGHDGTEREVKFKRNKEGNYKSMVLRADLSEEIRAVFTAQRKSGNLYVAAGGYESFVADFGKNAKISWADLRKHWDIPAAIQFTVRYLQGALQDLEHAQSKASCTETSSQATFFCPVQQRSCQILDSRLTLAPRWWDQHRDTLLTFLQSIGLHDRRRFYLMSLLAE